MHTRHHFPIGAIGFFPLVLLLFASLWGKTSMEPVIERYAALTEQTQDRLRFLDARSRDLRKSYGLLIAGNENTAAPSITMHHLKRKFGSTFEQYEDAAQHVSALTQRVGALEYRLNTIGKKIIHLDLSEQRATLIENGTIIGGYPISSGTETTPTPVGRFQIDTMQKLRVSSQFPETPYRMPHYMAFTPDGAYGLHALPYLGESPESSDYWQEARSHIGVPVSHGCVRLLPEDAETVYQWAEVGTPVIINA